MPVVFLRLMPYAVVIGLILGMGYWIYRTGYSSGSDDMAQKYEAAIKSESKRQEAANSAALEKAEQKSADLQREMSERDETIRLLTIEAQKGPDAASQCISSDGVQRLNRIK